MVNDDSPDNVRTFRLINGGATQSKEVEKLEELLNRAKAGEFTEIVFVGMKADGAGELSWSGPVSLAMLGCLQRAIVFLTTR